MKSVFDVQNERISSRVKRHTSWVSVRKRARKNERDGVAGWLNVTLDRVAASFAGADADAVVHREHEDFAVAEFALIAAASSFEDGIDRRLHEFFVNADLQLNLSQQVDSVVTASHAAGLATLSSEALAIDDRQSVHFYSREGFFHGVEPRGLDDGNDEFHRRSKFPFNIFRLVISSSVFGAEWILATHSGRIKKQLEEMVRRE